MTGYEWMLELEEKEVTNPECQLDCQCCDWTNTLWFSKAASPCVHRLQLVKSYQKYHIQQSAALLYSSTAQTKIKRHTSSVWQSRRVEDARSLFQNAYTVGYCSGGCMLKTPTHTHINTESTWMCNYKFERTDSIPFLSN